ncbi:tetratricopeptide repeat protein [Streptomyces sp. NBC_00273]|uniref:tetratricopeptide repeat protein n=1 Tax=Streptomyces sp. NBC_00273 TaxID=2903644 RepID=UPI002E29A165|nr:tetratricopeptide repeat protein [Streptomyces sp. NBC_00273]
MNRTGLFLRGQSLGARAIQHFSRVADSGRRVFGDEHPDTLAFRNNLACAYRDVGDLGRAIPLCQQNLADSVQILGGDHPETLISRNSLALAFVRAGDPRQAIALYDYPVLAQLLGNVAKCYWRRIILLWEPGGPGAPKWSEAPLDPALDDRRRRCLRSRRPQPSQPLRLSRRPPSRRSRRHAPGR